MKTLMDVVTLKDRLDAAGTAGPRTVLLDVRWALGDPHGREHYLAEHLPGAVFVDLATELAGPADPSRGRHPLPTLEQFQASARAWGIRGGDVVVAYDDSGNLAAARLWWMLRNAGIAEVYLLDGGLAAWRDAGFDVESGERQAEPGDVVLRTDGCPARDRRRAGGLVGPARAVAGRPGGGAVPRRVRTVDPRAGHIPGAVSAPTTATWVRTGGSCPRRRCGNASLSLGCAPMSPLPSTAAPASRRPTKLRPWKSPDFLPRSIPDRSPNGPTTTQTML